ncbi:hypothetical protein BS614_08775 [Paenibacillus xylanexedens]|uniref:hypothetical protein n=1 Tax=Paenibacillus xylanexedens TaxID=528191 RepID=UPI0009380CEE|nr:hypothetical protein [Paenibacillus xylanexedens]APO44092.1 hypothetical protein BS614_08775 [Paenibacillus xylanexedens]
MNYTSERIPILNLVLDPLNPRFVSLPSPNDESIKNYLVQNEDVITIARGINEDEGLMPGERIIVFRENENNYIVLEGNRRICACKLLLGHFITDRKIPSISETTKENIEIINVDVVESREAVQSTLYKRHIKGIRSWPTQAKLSFFANRYLAGEGIDEISRDTGSAKGKVTGFIQNYKLLQYALNLPQWREVELDSLDPMGLDINRFLRVFNSNSKYYSNKTAKNLLKLSFDENLNPISEYGEDIMNLGLYYIAKAAFLTKELTTRNHVDSISEFNTFMREINPIIDTEITSTQEDLKLDYSNRTEDDQLKNNNNSNILRTISGVQEPTEMKKVTLVDMPFKLSNPKPFVFFESLKWNVLQSNDIQDIGLMQLAKEIQKISKYNHYGWYTISATLLLRSLLEQSLKFYLRKVGEWESLTSNNQGKDPMLSQLIKFYKHNKRYEKLFVEKKYYSAFLNSVNDENITFLDTVVHNAGIILPSKEKLESITKGGMYTLIEYILNEKKYWKISR